MLSELDYAVSPTAVAGLYKDFLDVFVLDESDQELQEEIEALNLRVVTSRTVMNNTREKTDLARRLLEIL